MARNSEITFSQVAQIADAMKAAGHRPTARAVRERIGSGSMGTIHRFIQQYNGQQQSKDNEAAELPDSIAKSLMDFVQTEIATACEPVSNLLIEQKAEAEALAEENERLERIIDRLQRERDESEHSKAEAIGQLVAVRREYAEIRQDAESLKEIKSNQLREIDRLERNADADRAMIAELSATKRNAESMSAQLAELSTAQAVAQAKLTAAEENVKDLRERLAASETNAKNHYNEAKTANTHYQACAARLEEAARIIDDLRKKPQTPTKVIKPKSTKPAPAKAE